MKNLPDKIIVHHSADIDARDQADRINNYHKSRGFPLSSLGVYVGYHFLINHDGEVTRTRNDDEEGAHCKGYNFDSLGICLEGDFNIELPTKLQEQALGMLLAEKVKEYNIKASMIVPHRQFAATSCYGTNLPDDWAMKCYFRYELNYMTKILQWLSVLISKWQQ